MSTISRPRVGSEATLGRLQMLIGGEWVESVGGQTTTAYSPASGKPIAELPAGTREDAQRAIAAAQKAEPVLSRMAPAERAALCHRVAASLESHAEELAHALTLDQGKPLHSEATSEVNSCTRLYHQAAEDILRLHGETLPSADRNKRVITFYQARGTYAVITPWNFPYFIPAEYISACLAAGNPIVWAPAPSTSACSVVYARAISEADLPRGAFNLVIGAGPVVGDEIVSNPGTVGVCLTGSPATGTRIAERAAGKPLLLELGGNGPTIVLADADLDAAAGGIARGAYRNAGQVCAAAERVLVSRDLRPALLERVLARTAAVRLGDPFQPETTMGPLNNEDVAAKMDRHIADALQKGARVRSGGGRADGFPSELYYQPTVLENVTPEMLVNREESFGPIVPVLDVADYDDAIRIANDNAVGLVASVFTKNLKAAFYFAERLRAGIVNVNEATNYWETHIPFGGVAGKRSGIGRLGGMNTLRNVMDLRTMVIDLEGGGF